MTVKVSAAGGKSGTSNAAKLERRGDLDFTERLWDLCKAANSFEDMRAALAQVFRALQSGRLQPMVHKSNTTAIGTVARQCLMRTTDAAAAGQLRDNMHRLSDASRLVAAVAEIGLAKLRCVLARSVLN
jgi:hypothetical protein